MEIIRSMSNILKIILYNNNINLRSRLDIIIHGIP